MPQACGNTDCGKQGKGRDVVGALKKRVTALRRVRCCGPAVMGLSVCAEDLHKHKPAVVMLLQRHPGHNGGVSATAGVFTRVLACPRCRATQRAKPLLILSRRDDNQQGPTARAPIHAGTDTAGALYLAAGEPVRDMFNAVRIRPQICIGIGTPERALSGGAVLVHPYPAVYPRIRRFPLAESAGGPQVMTPRDTARRRITCAGPQALGTGPSLRA